MGRARRRHSLRTSEALRRLVYVLAALGVGACVLPFDDYPEGDVCEAGPDPKAPDPVLRGCDAGVEPEVAAAGASEESP